MLPRGGRLEGGEGERQEPREWWQGQGQRHVEGGTGRCERQGVTGCRPLKGPLRSRVLLHVTAGQEGPATCTAGRAMGPKGGEQR